MQKWTRSPLLIIHSYETFPVILLCSATIKVPVSPLFACFLGFIFFLFLSRISLSGLRKTGVIPSAYLHHIDYAVTVMDADGGDFVLFLSPSYLFSGNKSFFHEYSLTLSVSLAKNVLGVSCSLALLTTVYTYLFCGLALLKNGSMSINNTPGLQFLV